MQITVSSRHYNGKISRGTIFKKIYQLTLNYDTAMLTSKLEYCLNEQLPNHAIIELSVPMTFPAEQLAKIQQILTQVSSNEKYQPTTKNGAFDSKTLGFFDFIIENQPFELSKDDPLLKDFISLLNTQLLDDALNAAYAKIIKDSKICCVFHEDPEDFGKDHRFKAVKKYDEIGGPGTCTRTLLQCKKCGALFLHQGLDWLASGKDDYYSDYIQVKDEAEADLLNAKFSWQNFASAAHPMIHIGSDRKVRFELPRK